MRKYLFADEAGNFDFSKQSGASRYFILTTITIDDCSIGNEILNLRRDLAWRGLSTLGELHATTDSQNVRNEIFDLIQQKDFIIDTTILEKPKAQLHLRDTNERFYKCAWYYHFKYISQFILSPGDELYLAAATLGTKKKYKTMVEALRDVVNQSTPRISYQVVFWPASADPCLQIADYCCWAIQRKWESSNADLRSYDLIKNKIRTEFDLFSEGTTYHY